MTAKEGVSTHLDFSNPLGKITFERMLTKYEIMSLSLDGSKSLDLMYEEMRVNKGMPSIMASD